MVGKSKVIPVPIGTVNYQLTVISEPFRLPGRKAFVIRCKCSCGNETIVRKSDFIHGRIKSCGCRIADSSRARMTRHGMSYTRIYCIWQGMVRRTTAPKCRQFKRYGSLGICKSWLRFEGFLTWATSHGYSDGLSIDRIDNDKGYYPSNCRWATPKQQARNTSWNVHVKVDGREFTSLTEASEAYGLVRSTVEGRLKRGWEIEEAFHTPAGERFRKGRRMPTRCTSPRRSSLGA